MRDSRITYRDHICKLHRTVYWSLKYIRALFLSAYFEQIFIKLKKNVEKICLVFGKWKVAWVSISVWQYKFAHLLQLLGLSNSHAQWHGCVNYHITSVFIIANKMYQ